MKIVLLTLVLCTYITPGFAQDSTTALTPHMVGGSASMMTGYGLTYGYFFNDITAVKAKIFGFIETDGGDRDESTLIEMGVEFQRTFFAHASSRAYVLAGGYYSLESDEYGPYSPTDTRSVYRSREYAIGAGVGFEYSPLAHFLVHMDFGLTYRSYERDPVTTESYTYSSYPRKYLGVAAGAGLMYRF